MKTSNFELILGYTLVGYRAELLLLQDNAVPTSQAKTEWHISKELFYELGNLFDPMKYGGLLTDAVFNSDIMKEAWRLSILHCLHRKEKVRLQLIIEESEYQPSLHHNLQSLAWETLLDPKDRWKLATNQRILLSRLIKTSNQQVRMPLLSRPNPGIVVVIANPTLPSRYPPLPHIDTDTITAEISKELSVHQLVSMRVLDGRDEEHRATLSNITEALTEQYRILYLYCHGRFVDGEASLWLEPESGEEGQPISAATFVEAILKTSIPPVLVVLAACHSAGRIHDPEAGRAIGPLLARGGIPAVIAMVDTVQMATVHQLTPALVRQLLNSYTVDDALALARHNLRTTEQHWRPVLWMNISNGRLWKGGKENIDSNVRQFFSTPPHVEAQWIARQSELQHHLEGLEQRGVAVITGEPGAGKTVLASMLCAKISDNRTILWRKVDNTFDLSIFEQALRWHAGMMSEDSNAVDDAPENDSLFQILPKTGYVLCLDNVEQFTERAVNEEKKNSSEQDGFADLLDRLANCAREGNFRLILATREVPQPLRGLGKKLSAMSHDEASSLLSEQGCQLNSELFEKLYVKTGGLALFLFLATGALKALPTAHEQQHWIDQLVEDPNVADYLIKSVNDRLPAEQQRLMQVVAMGEHMMTSAMAVGRILQLESSAMPGLEALVNKHLLIYRSGSLGGYGMHSILWQHYARILFTDPRNAFELYHRCAGEHYAEKEEDYFRSLFHYSRAPAFEKCLEVSLKALLADNQVLPPGPLLDLLEAWQDEDTASSTIIQILKAEAYLAEARLTTSNHIFATLSRREDLTTLEELLCKVRAFEGLARVEIQRENYTSARDYTSRGLALLNSMQLPDLYMKRALGWLEQREGVIIGHLGRRREALSEQEAEIAALRNQDDVLLAMSLGEHLLRYGTALAELGESETTEQFSRNGQSYQDLAVEAFREAKTVFESLGFVRGVASALLNWGNLLSNLYNYAEADELYKQVHVLVNDERYVSDPKFIYLRAALWNAQGANDYEQGAYGQATDHMTRACTFYDSLGNDDERGLQGQVDSRYRLLDIATDRFRADPIQDNRHRLDHAMNEGEKVLIIVRKPDYPLHLRGLELCILRALADAYLARNNRDSGAFYLDEAWSLILDGVADDPTDLCLFFSARARLWLQRGQRLKALNDMKDALAYAERTGFRFFIDRIKQQLREFGGSNEAL